MMSNEWSRGVLPARLAGLVAPAIAAFALTVPGPTLAAIANCSASALAAYGVPGVTILLAVDVPASASNPEFCDVRGSLVTTGDEAPDGLAGFELQLPAAWNQKFLFWGVGGTGGSTYADFAANPVDYSLSLFKGYATAITDTGHQAGNTDAAWALISPGVPNSATLTDYYFRATHQVTAAAKNLVRAFYGAQDIKHSYFDGCSNGGRQAMVEATRFPEDFDGIIAGAPFMDIRSIIAGDKIQQVQLSSPRAYIPASMLPTIDQAVYASCDAADGVQDGLIQNPARCSFDPASLVCRNGATTNCLTWAQANTLKSYISALRDEQGDLIYPGASISDLTGGMDVWTIGLVPPTDFSANEPWGGTGFSPAPVAWQFVDHIMKFIVARDPTYNLRDFPISPRGVVDDRALAFFDLRTEAGDGDDPGKLQHFIHRGGKLIMFHGFSDPALPPFRTVKYYEQLADRHGGYRELQENVRLFMVPGMQHCVGGPGPNFFDTLSALESWNEAGTPPDAIVAAHYLDNDPALAIDRTMPLCKFPEQAQYAGSGAYNDGANWSCTNNHKLLEVGADGASAGL
ncbi:Feruloyl esterase [Burkholderiales bacterium]|nr:Feruloyl esterase [Burkholderiales bacterium]